MAMNTGAAAVAGKRRHRRRPVMAEINVTPMVDVMLVLLIIFAGSLYTANRMFMRATKSLAPTYNTTTVVQTSVNRLRQEAKLDRSAVGELKDVHARQLELVAQGVNFLRDQP